MDGDRNGQAEPIISPFNWRIWILGIYLFLLLAFSFYWLGGLMLADTTEAKEIGNTLKECKENANKANVASNSNSNATNNNTNSNTANVNANTQTTNTANTNATSNGNTDRRSNSTSPNPATNTTTVKGSTATPPSTATQTPTPAPPSNANPSEKEPNSIPKIVKVEGFSFFPDYGCLTADGYVFLIVLFSGMLGAVIRAVYSFIIHLGRKDFGFNWIWYYLLLPYFGGILSLILYFVIRGGFYSGSIGKPLLINLFSFAALGALTGLFSDQALEKLKLVAESLLTKTESKTNQPVIAKIAITPQINLSATSPTQKLTATAIDAQDKPISGLPTNPFQWNSDKPNIATVDQNGLVTRVTTGSCNVTATAKSNAVVSNKCEVECT